MHKMIYFIIGSIIGFTLCLLQVYYCGLLDGDKVSAAWIKTLKNMHRSKVNTLLDTNTQKKSEPVIERFDPEKTDSKCSDVSKIVLPQSKPVDWPLFEVINESPPARRPPAIAMIEERLREIRDSKGRSPVACEDDAKFIIDDEESVESFKQYTKLEDTLSSPVWSRDRDHPNCMICKKKFTIRRRKHHCRNCGSVICSACSSTRRVLLRRRSKKKNTHKPRRICDVCDEGMTVASEKCADHSTRFPSSTRRTVESHPVKHIPTLNLPRAATEIPGRKSLPSISKNTNLGIRAAADSRRSSERPSSPAVSGVSDENKERKVEDEKIEQKSDGVPSNTSSPIDDLTSSEPKLVNGKLIPGMFKETEYKDFIMDEETILKSTSPKTWCNAPGKTFNLRIGPDYALHGKKAPSLASIYRVFAIDIYNSEKKIANIDRFYNMPRRSNVQGDYDIPPILMINVMTPEYAPSWFSPLIDGRGFSFVIFAELEEWARETLKRGKLSPALKLYQEFVRGGKKSKYSDCLKVVARICNNGEASKHYGAIARNLVDSYNGRPFLARTSTQFYYSPKHYFAIDLDIHVFGKIARRGLYSLKDFFGKLIIDCGFVIEGRSNNELPEQVLTALRMLKLDQQLARPFPFGHLL